VTTCAIGSALDHSIHNPQRNQPDIQEEDDDEPPNRPLDFGPASKRTRTTSPHSARRAMVGRRAEREKGKQERWGKIMQNRKMDRDWRFMNDVLENVPQFTPANHGMFSVSWISSTEVIYCRSKRICTHYGR
jgi:hypothetical protein